MVVDFGEPFFLDVLERRWGADGEADEEDVGLRVGQWTQAVVVLLTCRGSSGETSVGRATTVDYELGRTCSVEEA